MTGAVEMVSGDTAEITCTVYQADGTTPQSLVGATAIKWALSKKITSADSLLSKSLGSGITVSDAVNGVIVISLQPVDTAAIKGGDYVHEVEVTDASGNVATVLQDDFTLLDDHITT